MRLIDADMLVGELHTQFFYDGRDRTRVYAKIQEQPTIEERKTGEWIDDCSCSVCHWIHENDDCCVLLTDYKYCPNCGARMESKT